MASRPPGAVAGRLWVARLADRLSHWPGAATLSAALVASGALTYAFFTLASHQLDPHAYGEVVLLWTLTLLVVSIAYRPLEQLLMRTRAIGAGREAERRAHRTAAAVIAAVLGALALIALVGGLLGGGLFAVPVLVALFLVAVAGYAGSYCARGVLAGDGAFGLYGLLVGGEAAVRLLGALAVATGIAAGAVAAAAGIALAPVLSSLCAAAVLLRRRARHEPPLGEPAAAAEALGPSAFVLGATVVMACEQIFLGTAPLLVRLGGGTDATATAGYVFDGLLIAFYAPHLLFQGVQTSLLRRLATLHGSGSRREFRATIAYTVGLALALGGTMAVILGIGGHSWMTLMFGVEYPFGNLSLATLALAAGAFLVAGALTQAALALGRARQAGALWALGVAIFALSFALPLPGDELLGVALGLLGASVLLALALLRQVGES